MALNAEEGDIRALLLSSSGIEASTTLLGAGDPLLSTLAHDQTQDAAVLKFDFVPSASKVRFDYRFGSSEYNRWVDSEFNDAFGAFVNGVNVALIPGTTSALTINTLPITAFVAEPARHAAIRHRDRHAKAARCDHVPQRC